MGSPLQLVFGNGVLRKSVKVASNVWFHRAHLSRERLHLAYVDSLYVLGLLHFLHLRLQTENQMNPAQAQECEDSSFVFALQHV